MSRNTRQEVLTQMRRRYRRAGLQLKAQLPDQLVELSDYHSKAAIRAFRSPPGPDRAASFVLELRGYRVKHPF